MSCSGCRKIVKGASGITKAITGTDPVTRDVRLAREAECDACDQRRGPMCNRCHCVVAAKVRVASERCPLNKW